MKAQLDNKEMDAKNTQADKKLESELELKEMETRARLEAKKDDEMPDDHDEDTDWNK